MPNFQYIARNGAGAEVNGLMQADNEAAVLRSLDEKQLFPVQVREQVVARTMAGGVRVRMRDVGMLYGQLADLLRSGVPLMRSLETLGRALPNRTLAEAVRRTSAEVASGKTLSDAMALNPKIFTPLHTAMVHAGERGGFLEDVLTNMGEFLDRQDDIQSKIMGALIYPLVLVCVGAVVMLILLLFVVPQFRTVFSSISLPVPTKILFAMSGIMQTYWPVVLGVLVLLAVVVAGMMRSEAGRVLWDRFRLKAPLIGKVFRISCITRFCRILGTMLANGVPILQALSISKDAIGSAILSKSVEEAGENVRRGASLADPLKMSGSFPPEIVEMIAVAEESNQLEKTLVHIADTVERRMSRQLDSAVRLIEPLILVVLAGVIGFMALGLLYPIFTMARTLEK